MQRGGLSLISLPGSFRPYSPQSDRSFLSPWKHLASSGWQKKNTLVAAGTRELGSFSMRPVFYHFLVPSLSVYFPGLVTPASPGSIRASMEWSPLLKRFSEAHLPQVTCVTDYLLVMGPGLNFSWQCLYCRVFIVTYLAFVVTYIVFIVLL